MNSDPDDRPAGLDEFLAAVEGTIPLQPPNRADITRARPPPAPIQSQLDQHAVLRESLEPVGWDDLLDVDEELSYLRPGVDPQVLRKLRRGIWVVQAQIDLHGLNRDQARTALAEFVHSAVRQNKRCLRVIHGKGLGSKQRRPILKALAKRWLRLSDNVLAFCQARPFDGGDGVLLVLLRGHKDNASTLPVGHSS